MASVIRMPEVLAGAMEGVIASWAVKEGDNVNVGDVVAEIETEKATVEYQAEESGTVAKLVAQVGQSIDVGEPIAVFSAPGDSDADVTSALGQAGVASADSPSQSADTVEQSAFPVSDDVSAKPRLDGAESEPAEVVLGQASGRLFASPLARKIAKERGLDLSGVTGSGPGGRIVRKDLESLLASAPHAASTQAPTAAPQAAPRESAQATPGFVEIPHSGMRRAIARRLTESKSTVPHFYLRAHCVVDKLLEVRQEVNDGWGIKTSVNDWVVKAVGHALMAVPGARVVWTPDAMRQFDHADISVAVATEGGLYTPVVNAVDTLSVREINQQIRELAERARAGTLKQQEIEGGSFAVTNLGMFGTEEFSAILNPPQSGILAVGAATKKAIVIDDEIRVASLMTVTLSADHRAIDGALAAEWMAAFTRAIEHPLSLLVN